MDVTPLVPEGVQIIQGYGNGGFRVAQVWHQGPVLVMPETTVPWPVTPATALAPLDPATLEPILAAAVGVDILLIGTGPSQVFVPPAIRQRIRERGPVAEMMDTGAACRTFNLLLAEGRRVAAALLPVD